MKREESGDRLVLDRIAGARDRCNGICAVLIFHICLELFQNNTGWRALLISECDFPLLTLTLAYVTTQLKVTVKL